MKNIKFLIKIIDNPFLEIDEIDKINNILADIINFKENIHEEYNLCFKDECFSNPKIYEADKDMYTVFLRMSNYTDLKFNDDDFYFEISFINLTKKYIKTLEYEKISKTSDIHVYEFLINKFFNNIEFKPNIANDIKNINPSFPQMTKTITYHLISLNDKLLPILEETSNLVEICRRFQSSTKISTSLEGDAAKVREKLSFSFKSCSSLVKCEPHTKIEYFLDLSGTQLSDEYFYNRIYFNIDCSNKKIRIGHIGDHL